MNNRDQLAFPFNGSTKYKLRTAAPPRKNLSGPPTIMKMSRVPGANLINLLWRCHTGSCFASTSATRFRFGGAFDKHHHAHHFVLGVPLTGNYAGCFTILISRVGYGMVKPRSSKPFLISSVSDQRTSQYSAVFTQGRTIRLTPLSAN